jgi:anti-sigma B factor antagonist
MDLVCESINGVMVIIPAGPQLDASTADEFKDAITPILDANQQVLVDLSRLDFVDSSGLGAFLICLRHAQAQGGDMKLCSMLPQVRQLFELVRLHRLFHIFDTQDAALKTFES